MTDRNNIAHGLLWSSFERFGDLFIKFGIQLFLARLLLPEDFGLVAMIAVFMAVGIGIMDSGFTQVVIQRPQISEEELSTIFFANLVIGVAMTLLVFYTAPFIAEFYSEPELTALLRFFSLTIIFTAVGRIQSSQMMRAMLFKRISLITLPAHLIGGILAVILAYMGFGAWALVWNGVFSVAMASIGFWFAMGWRPTRRASWNTLKNILPFGTQMLGVRILNLITENSIFLLVGRVFSVTQVGYLQRAQSLRMISNNTLCVVGERVLFPHFSRLQADIDALKVCYLKSLFYGGIIFSIILSYLAANATDIIVLLFGLVWLPSAPYFEVLCAFGFIYVFHRIVLVYIKSQGAGAFLLRLTVVEQSMLLLVIVVSVHWGIVAMLWCMVASSILSLLIKFELVRRNFKCPLILQIKNIFIPLVLGLLLWRSAQCQLYDGDSVILRLLLSASLVACLVAIAVGLYLRKNNVDLIKISSLASLRALCKSIL